MFWNPFYYLAINNTLESPNSSGLCPEYIAMKKGELDENQACKKFLSDNLHIYEIFSPDNNALHDDLKNNNETYQINEKKIVKFLNDPNNTKFISIANIPSSSEILKASAKYEAFIPAKVSTKAKEMGLTENYKTKTAYFPLRDILPTMASTIFFVNDLGKRVQTIPHPNVGLRVAFNLLYIPDFPIVKKCKMIKRSAFVSNNGIIKKVTSTAPIIALANKTKCLWLNKEECENNKEKAMQLWTLDLVDRAKIYNTTKIYNNSWARTQELNNQCEDWLNRNLSNEERKILLPVELSVKDGFKQAGPIIKPQKSHSEITQNQK